ncbi:RagB/SusD family nutrient uptake outer membrane protein [Gillisia sp. Hel_I_86]|uniref:RagB/SusD family nutrient uptake outer membrane protein n=1 Tax=Gillisia sp. Hel_I_86 TaxID=1249981 RepID=UPI0021BD3056|nr:RagB/SusD family nutrient uptake outer membrane protein [Gillisia sp. Hel_I_86]
MSTILLWSCQDDLELKPEDNRETSATVFDNPDSYREFTAKLYAGFSLSGQQGPAGNADLAGLDEGFSNYMRLFFKLQELTTDEAVIGWNDGTIKDLHSQTWTSGNEFIRTMYSRLLYQIALTNEFLRQTTDAKLDARGVTGDLKSEIAEYRAEARFLRALSYYHAMDLFGNPPFVTEEDPIGAFLPPQIQRADLFSYIEGELLAIESTIVPARQNEYGRADQAAVWMLLSKLYLNSEVYTGQGRYTDVIAYTTKVIQAGYSIPDVPYQYLFLADNDTNGAQEEVIFPITFDGLNTQAYGGMTFIIHASIGGSMDPANFGVSSGWAGLRTTPQFVNLFPNGAESEDKRAIFYTEGQNKEINNISVFTDGFAVAKYKNVDINGNQGSDSTGEFPDTDFPMFRLADAYLMYAEAVLRGGGGSTGEAVTYINELKERAYGDSSGNIAASDLTLDFIINERGRELYWEAQRRTDLIRFNQFTENGIWAFKGGVPQGTTTSSFRNIMPIPASDLGVNTNLKQNPGY